jgi:hypothetical protein
VRIEPGSPLTCGETLTITATPDNGWQFIGWTGDVTAIQNPLVHHLTGSFSLVANFSAQTAERPYTLTVQSAGKGSTNQQPAGPYVPGQVVKVTAQPDSGFLFTGWTGAQQAVVNPLHLQITGSAQLTANFAPRFNLHLPIARQVSPPGGDEGADGCN